MADIDATRSYDERKGAGEKSESAKAEYSTLRRAPRVANPTTSFTGRMAFFSALTAVMTAAILSIVLAVVWEQQFQGYTRQNMQRLAQQTADTLGMQYDKGGDRWTSSVIEYAKTTVSAYPDISMQILDANDALVYDETAANRAASGKMSHDSKQNPVPSSANDIVSAEVIDNVGKKVGTVRLWAFGSEALITKSDAAFRQNSYTAILMAAAVAIFLASIIGYYTSRALTRPIKKITATATQIRNGDLTARTGLKGTDEIGQLGETFDGMATELERDIKFEHRLTSDVAHELRTPLMAMQATVEAMQDGVLPADDEHFETVASEVRRLSRLVDAMLHLSRVENNEKFKTEKTDMVFVLKSLVTMQQQLFADCDLRLRFDDKTPNHELFADVNPDLIREAITNLMSNAMRYTPAGGWVVVSIGYEGRSYMQISVRDTGIGIAKEDIPRVFSRFWRSDASRERVSGGLGVGLALTKEIVDKHNGSISVESELGKGTTFTLHIPLEHKAGSPSREE